MTTTLLLDLLVAALLSATIFYCWQLNRRLVVLRGGHDELRLLIENLNEATRRAQAATAELKSSSDAVGSRLNAQMGGARALVDELKLIVEAGNTLADRVSGGLRGVSGRPITGSKPAPAEKAANAASCTGPMRWAATAVGPWYGTPPASPRRGPTMIASWSCWCSVPPGCMNC